MSTVLFYYLHVHTPLRRFITSTRSYRGRAYALHATTSSCVLAPTATAYASHNLHPSGCTRYPPDTSVMWRHVHIYNIHVHIHRDCTCACAFHLHFHLGRNAPPSVTRIMRAACHLLRRNAPYRDATCAPQRTTVVVRRSYVTYAHSFLFSFLFFSHNTLDGHS